MIRSNHKDPILWTSKENLPGRDGTRYGDVDGQISGKLNIMRQRELYMRLRISGIVVQLIKNFVEYVGVNMGILVPLLIIDRIMSKCSRTHRVTHLRL